MEIIDEKHIDLYDKGDAFLRWYYDTRYAYSTINVYEKEVEKLSNFVEKLADWFDEAFKKSQDEQEILAGYKKFLDTLPTSEKGYLTEVSGLDFRVEEKLREELLNAVMYRIMIKGGAEFGPKNGLAFAKMCSLNPQIPLMYAPDKDNKHLINMYYDYQSLNGDDHNQDFTCYLNYFQKENKDDCKEIPFSQIGEIVNSIDVIMTESDEEKISMVNQGLENLEEEARRK